MKYKKFDISQITIAANIILIIINHVAFIYFGENIYINLESIYLIDALSIFSILIIRHQCKYNNPFIIILSVVTTIFYCTRVITLLYDPWSLVLMRYPFQPSDLNNTIFYILLANISIFLGLNFGKNVIPIKNIEDIKYSTYKFTKFTLIIMLFSICIFLNYYLKFNAGEFLNSISSYFTGIIFSPYMILLLIIIYYILNERLLSNFNKFIIYLLFFIFLFSLMLYGSRSGLLTIFTIYFISTIAINGTLKVSKTAFLLAIAISPLFYYSFIIATELRELEYNQNTVINFERLLYAISQTLTQKETHEQSSLTLIFDRVGYLTYAADIISNHEIYSQFINFNYYLKSIIDNCFTPGFDIFDTPKAANSLRYLYLNLPDPTIQDVIDTYTSDMFTVYGEYYNLFGGYFSLIPLFFISYFFKFMYLHINSNNLYKFYLYRAFLLLIFYNWLTSFGFDWMIKEIISFSIPIIIWSGLFKNRK